MIKGKKKLTDRGKLPHTADISQGFFHLRNFLTKICLRKKCFLLFAAGHSFSFASRYSSLSLHFSLPFFRWWHRFNFIQFDKLIQFDNLITFDNFIQFDKLITFNSIQLKLPVIITLTLPPIQSYMVINQLINK